jgi:hypothetical protein
MATDYAIPATTIDDRRRCPALGDMEKLASQFPDLKIWIRGIQQCDAQSCKLHALRALN